MQALVVFFGRADCMWRAPQELRLFSACLEGIAAETRHGLRSGRECRRLAQFETALKVPLTSGISSRPS